MLRVYRKKWNQALGVFTDEPVHDDASHYADAFMVFAVDFKPRSQTKRISPTSPHGRPIRDTRCGNTPNQR